MVVERPGEPGQGVGGDAGGLGELRSRGGGRGKPENMAAARGPHVGEHLEGGGLARPGRGEDQLDPAAVRRHGPHHLLLPGVQDGARRFRLGQGEVDRSGLQGLPVGQSSRVHDSLLSGEDPAGGVLGAAGHGEHRRTIRPPLLGRHIGGVVDWGEPDRPGDRLLHHGRGDLPEVGGMDGGAAQLPLGLGPQMPELPGRPMLLHCGEHPVRRPGPPHRRGGRHRRRRRIQHLIEHRVDPLGSAERVDRFGAPDGALLGQGAGFVLGDRGSPAWPAAPAAASPPGPAADHDHG